MDPNGLRFWMLANRCDWRPGPGAAYDRDRRSLRLSSQSQRTLDPYLPNPALAASLVERPAQVRDAVGTRAYWDGHAGQVLAAGAAPGAVPIFTPPEGQRVSDLAIDPQGVLYLALRPSGAIVLQDRRDRWDPLQLEAPGFEAWRLAADPQGGAWALDRTNRRLARIAGQPFPRRPLAPYAPGVARPCPENPNPPHVDVYHAEAIPAGERAAGLAASPLGQVAWLSWVEADGESRLRLLLSDGSFSAPLVLEGAQWAYSLAWVNAGEVAVMVTGLSEAPVYPLPEDPGELQWCEQQPGQPDLRGADPIPLRPVGSLYPLPGHNSEPFAQGTRLPPHFPLSHGDPSAGPATAPLYHLSLPSFARTATASGSPTTPFDSGDPQTVWHRLYVEADLPPGCGALVWLAAGSGQDAADPELEWFAHVLGAAPRRPEQPQAAWLPFPSEVPHHPGLLQCPREKDRSGLFTVLIQRAGRRVRSLRGRYLHVRVELFGSGRASPEIAALRAYASRFSYLERYLPQLYHETLFGSDADEIGPTTPADFLERLIDNFEGMLTPIEDRVAAAYLLTDPHTTPDSALEWLGGWVGMAFDPAYPPEHRRAALENAAELYRLHGTLPGLELALDIATGGAVSGGEIVLLEDFRLRRTFATLLGIELARTDDPLTAGISVSGNSFVGDTLFLGDQAAERRREFMALFGAAQVSDPADRQAVMALYDRLAHHATVLVHQEVEPQDLGLIRRVIDLEAPAHVEVKILKATRNFLVGMASLLGVDTYLSRKPQPRPVRLSARAGYLADGYNVNERIDSDGGANGRRTQPGLSWRCGLAGFGSALGVRDLLISPASLDPRLEAGLSGAPPPADRPIAVAGPPKTVEFGQDFELDASGSRAAPGRFLTRFIWERKD
jgi:phage tail-like protein